MPTLILDTSTERGIVAIIDGNDILFVSYLPYGLQNSQFLLPEIKRGLMLTRLKPEQLSLVATGVGPGSYTGMRVGSIVAKTLSFSCNIPLVGVCSLDLFIPDQPVRFASIIDAKIGGVYLQVGTSHYGEIKFLSGPQVLSLPLAIEQLQYVDVLITPNASQLRQKLEASSNEKRWDWVECYPSPHQMAKIVQEKMDRSEYSLDGHLDLLYLRKTQAEIEKG